MIVENRRCWKFFWALGTLDGVFFGLGVVMLVANVDGEGA